MIAIIVSDVIGICVIVLLFSYCYSRVCSRGKSKDENRFGFDQKESKERKKCLCFRKDEYVILSENVEHYDLVPLDAKVTFDLDELLKASAFVLGKSGIGIVYKVVFEDGLALAVRRLGERFAEVQGIHTEVEAIRKLRHPCIVTLRAYYWSVDEKKLLIHDFIPNGNFATGIHGKPGLVSFTPLSWSMRVYVTKGVAKGLVFLHEYSPKKYVQGDPKPSNILPKHDMEPKISDFQLRHLANIAGESPTLQSSHMIYEKPQQSTTPSEVATKVGRLLVWSGLTGNDYWKITNSTGRNSGVYLIHWLQLYIEEKKPLLDVLH